MTRGKRLALSVATALIFVVGAGMGVLLTTEWGLHLAFAVVKARLPGELSVGTLHGRLLGRIVIQDLGYAAPSLRLRIHTLDLKWRPAGLLTGTFHVDYLESAGIDIQLPPSPPATQPVALPRLNLPLRIAVHRTRIEDLQLRRPGAEPVVVERLELAGTFTERRLGIDTLRVVGPRYDVALNGEVLPQQGYAVKAAVQWTVTPPDLNTVKGAGTINGTPVRLQVYQRISTPADLDVTVTLLDLFGALHWRASATVRELDPHAITARWMQLPITGTLSADGDTASVQAEASLSARVPDAGPVQARLKATATRQHLEVEELTLALVDRGGKIDAQGSADLSADLKPTQIVAQGTWQNMAWPLRGRPSVASQNGAFRIRGLPEDYQFHLDASLRGERLPPGQWSADGVGNLHKAALNTVRVQTLNGEITGDLTLAWSPKISWSMALAASGINPGAFWKDWPAHLGARFISDGRVENKQLNMSAEIADLNGTLRGVPLQAVAKVLVEGDHYVLPQLNINSTGTRLSASGELGNEWSLRWSMETQNIAPFWPQAQSGHVAAQGNISGPRHQPRVVGHLDAANLALAQFSAGTLNADVDLDTTDRHRSSLSLAGTDLVAAGNTIKRLETSADGTLAQHRLTARIEGAADINVAIVGGYRQSVWRGILDQAELRGSKFGDWTLEKAAPMEISARRIFFRNSCWNSGASRFCTGTDWQAGHQSRFNASAKQLPLALFTPFLPPQITVKGKMDADVETVFTGKDVENLTARVDLGATSVTLPLHGEEVVMLDVQRGDLALTGGAQGLDGQLSVVLAKTGAIKGDLHLPGYHRLTLPSSQQPLQVALNAQLADLSFLPTFVPLLEDTAGRFDLALAVDGTLGQPKATGQAALQNGTAVLINERIRLKDVNVTAETRGGDRIALQGSARSGKGSISFDGDTHIGGGWPTKVHISGERFEVLARPDLRAAITPDLHLEMEGQTLRASGEVKIPSAKIEPQEARERSELVTTSEDVIIINAARPQKPKTNWTLILNDLNVVLGDSVKFQGYGLRGQVKGELLLNKQPEKLMTATGNLNIVNGQYQAYGQDLTISQGNLVFAGSAIDNPAVDLRAVRVVGDITAGIEVKGRLKEPVLSLFSQPPMEETFILSYLLLGHPPGETTATEAELLVNAASALGLSGGYMIARRLAQSLGIEETHLEKDTLVLGRSLGPNIYISYGIALTNPSNTLQIRYQIAKHWILKTETGDGSQADLLFSIER